MAESVVGSVAESHYELASDKSVISQSQIKNSKSNVISKNSSLLSSCRICLSRILDPAYLTCGHKFCERCLEKYWDLRDRPDFIVCPLCRGYAFDVNFSKPEPNPTTVDFRKTFRALDEINETIEARNSTMQCVRLSILVPIVYYTLKWLRLPLAGLFSFLHLRFSDM